MQTIVPQGNESLLELAERCDALYICPKVQGIRKGPLVPYAGKDAQGRNLVGDIYFNFAMIEQHQQALLRFTDEVADKLHAQSLIKSFDTILGVPEGGRTFGQGLAYFTGKRFVYATKLPKPTEAGKKQEYSWDLSRFTFERGERVAIAEDVFNNFQNTDTMLAEVAAFGAEVVLLVGALNRSPIHSESYMPKSGPLAGMFLPVVASIREAYPEYEQDDPEVAADIAAGNLELNVRPNWQRLRDIMSAHS